VQSFSAESHREHNVQLHAMHAVVLRHFRTATCLILSKTLVFKAMHTATARAAGGIAELVLCLLCLRN
jgi:hypothetical protein